MANHFRLMFFIQRDSSFPTLFINEREIPTNESVDCPLSVSPGTRDRLVRSEHMGTLVRIAPY